MKIWKPICFLALLALVFSLAAIPLILDSPSAATAQNDMICEESLVDYTGYGSGAYTEHCFSVPVTATAPAEVLVEYRGDFGDWDGWDRENEFIEVYIDGDYIGRDHTDWDDCDTRWKEVTWSLTAAQMREWAADGDIMVKVDNSDEVDTFCSYNEHRVTLCYTLGVLPVAAFSATPTVGEAPLTVQFRNKSTGDIYDDGWLWDFGDGRGHQRNPSHTYYNEGTYRVCLTVEGPGGEDRMCKTIMVEAMAVPGKISVRNLNITPVYAQPRQAVAISANVANEGGIWGSQTVNLMINGQFEQSSSVGIAPGTVQPVSFTVYKVEPGEYQVEIAGVTGTFHVMETEPAPTPKTGLLAGGELDSGGIIAIVVIGIILVGGVIVAVLFTRRA